MIRRINNLTFPMLFAMLLMGLIQSALAQQPSVVVKTYGQHFAGNIVYHHEVTNNSSRDVVKLAIGLDTDQTSPNSPPTRESGELNFVMPVGSGVSNLQINPASVSGPTGWKAEIIQIEDSGRFMQWDSPGYPQPDIQPGQTFRFSVTVPTIATGYLTGHFSAGYADGKEPWFYNGTMEKLDVTPPTLSVTLTPATIWPPNEKMVAVTATITVKDDYDPQPEIKLESITANEVLDKDDIKAHFGIDERQFQLKAERNGKNKVGRIYTITYSATDGSGNKTMTSATVTVPHDREDGENRGREEGRGKK